MDKQTYLLELRSGSRVIIQNSPDKYKRRVHRREQTPHCTKDLFDMSLCTEFILTAQFNI
jgi:hypothetical protein